MAAVHDPSLAPNPPAPRRVHGVNWIGVWTLYRKEVWRFINVITKTVAEPVVHQLMFLAVFTLALGRDVQVDADREIPAFLATGRVQMALRQYVLPPTPHSYISE